MARVLTRLFIILASQAPLLGALWVGRTWIKDRPFLSLILFLLYETSLLLFGFGRKVLGEVEKRAVQHLADLIWIRIISITPGFLGRYKKLVVSEHGVFNVRGLGLINTYTLALDQVFVDLRVAASQNPQKSYSGLFGARPLPGHHQLWNFLQVDSAKNDGIGLAIIGAPGCGKTTLLQHVALTCAAGQHGRYHLSSRIPILLFLRDHISTIVKEKSVSLADLAQLHFSDSALFPGLKPPLNWFQERLSRGACIVLLDGLDEVADLNQRRIVSSWVDNQIKSYRRNRFVLTARPQGYISAPLQRAHVLEVLPFTRTQVETFINNWYLANEVVSSGYQITPEVQARASKDADKLLAKLHESPSLEALTANPLLLTMIAMVHRYHGALPGSRVELYKEICEVLLGRWRQTRGVKEALSLTASKKLVVLKPLATHMMNHNLRDIGNDEAMSVVAAPLKKIGVTGKDTEDFLSLLQDSSGLLIERESGHWSFAHLTFQEYLTAAYWLEHKDHEPNWRAMVGSSWWTETLRLYAAQADATPLVQGCLEVDSVESLALAVECLDEAQELDEDVRNDINERLIGGLESSDQARRSLAAEVRLSRRLQSLHRLDDHCKIDLEYLTCAEYQLFLDDKEGYGRNRQPDHWQTGEFLLAQARDFVAGMRADDAAEFCRWLSYRWAKRADYEYRLPTINEATQHAGKSATRGTWCRDNDKFGLVGMASIERQKILQQLAMTPNFSLPLPGSLALARNHKPFYDVDALSHEAIGLYQIATGRYQDHPLDTGTARRQALAFAVPLALSLNEGRDVSIALHNARARNLSRHHLNKSDALIDEALSAELDEFLFNSTAYDTHLKPFVNALKENDLKKAKQLANDLCSNFSLLGTKAAIARLLKLVIEAAEAETGTIALRKLRESLASYLQLVIQSTVEPERKQTLLDAFWWVQIQISRADGTLPAWEGLRIIQIEKPTQSR